MTKNHTMPSLFRENKTLFILIAVGIFLIELEIFAVAAINSGRKSWLEIKDQRGNIIHVSEGNNLSSFNKYYFEKTFGPLDQYQVNRVSKDEPFPFRAWFAAAIGIPVGAILLFGFITRAFSALIYGDRIAGSAHSEAHEPIARNRLETLMASISRLNIFAIGFLVLLAMFTYWVVPNLILYIGQAGIDTILRFKWFFLAVALIILGIMAWIIYLRYLLAKKTIDSQTEVEKFRLQLAAGNAEPLRLEYSESALLTNGPGVASAPSDQKTVKSRSPLNL
ncbi:MAG: hypothetical protein Q7U40_07550 [Desulfatirhabdiaceae bacterium]|nr:hypothetical protein [Desulfatirhabdiaceae bacterium]